VAAPGDRDPGWDWMRPAEFARHLTEEQGRLVRALEWECAVVRLRPVPPMGVLRIVVACWDEGWDEDRRSANARPPDRQWQVEADGTRTALAA
jgi:hypothetical protein